MKKIIIYVLSSVVLITFCGCADNKQGKSVNSANQESSSTTMSTTLKLTSTPTSTLTSTSPLPSPSTSTPETKNYLQIGFDLDKKETLFLLDNSLHDKDVLKKFGEPDEKSEEQLWGADGLKHQSWYYLKSGIELGFVRNEKDEVLVSYIKLSKPCNLKTNREISIGSTKDEVLKAYNDEINPEENNEDASRIIAGSKYGGVIFTLDNDSVSEIFIGAAAE